MVVPYELAVPLRGDEAVTSVDSIHEQKLLGLPFCTLNGDNVAPLPKGVVFKGAWQGLLRVQVLPWPAPGLQAASPLSISFQRAALRRTQDLCYPRTSQSVGKHGLYNRARGLPLPPECWD